AAGEWSWWRSILFVWSVAARAAWCYLLAGHGGYWRTDVRLPGRARAPARRRWPSVAAVVPARDEAAILPETLPTLLAQDYPGAFRVVLVDDASSDGTGAAAAALGAAASGEPVPAAPGGSRGGAVSTLGDAVSTGAGSVVGVVGGTPPPAGWAGKVWAMAQGAATAGECDYLLFTDADIAFEPGTVTGLVRAAVADDRALVSQMAMLRAETGWER